MALTAQSEEERVYATQVAHEYLDTHAWKNSLNGWAAVSLGILASDDRERSLRSVAAVMGELPGA